VCGGGRGEPLRANVGFHVGRYISPRGLDPEHRYVNSIRFQSYGFRPHACMEVAPISTFSFFGCNLPSGLAEMLQRDQKQPKPRKGGLDRPVPNISDLGVPVFVFGGHAAYGPLQNRPFSFGERAVPTVGATTLPDKILCR
jgi:hypothetical protein